MTGFVTGIFAVLSSTQGQQSKDAADSKPPLRVRVPEVTSQPRPIQGMTSGSLSQWLNIQALELNALGPNLSTGFSSYCLALGKVVSTLPEPGYYSL